MKLNKNIKNLLPIAAFALSLTATSCVSDLDVDPTIDKNTDITFNQDANFRKIYANMALTGQQVALPVMVILQTSMKVHQISSASCGT